MEPVLWFLLGYLLGSVPVGYILGRLNGVDLRQLGSGNIGTANVNRVLGPFWAALTALGDVLKGMIPTIIAGEHFVFASTGALLGSVFSVFLGFRGGKGFATLAGVWLGVAALTDHWEIIVVSLALWTNVLLLSGYSSLANLSVASLLPSLAALTGDTTLFLLAVFSTILIFFSHRRNIRRLMAGKEHRFDERVENERW